MELDPNTLISTVAGGAVVWATMRADVKYLLRDVGRMQEELKTMWEHIHGR